MKSLTVVGNGAHRTGAPLSLLAILRRRPAGISLRSVLVGGGPLEADYSDACDDVVVLDAPSTPGLRLGRLAQEARLLRSLSSLRPRHEQERFAVNTIEYEASLVCGLRWPLKGRVMIRERPGYAQGARGRLRTALLRRYPSGNLCGVGRRQAEDWSDTLGRPVRHLVNIYEPRPEPTPVDDGLVGLRFLVVGGRSPTKGVDLARSAWSHVTRPDCQLLVASNDFPIAQDGQVRWLGDVPGLADRFETVADVMLGVSRHETFSRAVVEAAFAGVPTLAWDAEGYPEQIEALGGWLAPAGDAVALARKVEELAAMGRSAIRDEGQRVRRRAVEQFDADAAAAAWWDWLLA
jgi:Glycosyl transferases group 1